MFGKIKEMADTISYHIDILKCHKRGAYIESTLIVNGEIIVFYRLGKVPILHEISLHDFYHHFFHYLTEHDKCLVYKLYSLEQIFGHLVKTGDMDTNTRDRALKTEVSNEGL